MSCVVVSYNYSSKLYSYRLTLLRHLIYSVKKLRGMFSMRICRTWRKHRVDVQASKQGV